MRALELVLAAIEFLVLARATWEEDQMLAVCLEACDVECKGFLGQVLPAVIKGDANGGGEFAGDAGLLRDGKVLSVLKSRDCRLRVWWVLRYLQLHQGKPSTGSNAAVVFDCRTSDNWSELVNRARSDGCGFGDTSCSATRFATGLGSVRSV